MPQITARGIQIALGCLWLIDGALQLQKQMFTDQFANSVIAPAAIGQPSIVAAPIHLEVSVMLLHPALFDLAFALIQLALGGFILWRRTTKPALLA